MATNALVVGIAYEEAARNGVKNINGGDVATRAIWERLFAHVDLQCPTSTAVCIICIAAWHRHMRRIYAHTQAGTWRGPLCSCAGLSSWAAMRRPWPAHGQQRQLQCARWPLSTAPNLGGLAMVAMATPATPWHTYS